MGGSELDKDLQTGVTEIDREHALELELVRSIRSALADDDPDTVRALLQQLEDVTNAHFLGEQLLMRLHAYPGYEAHQEEHDRLMREFEAIARRLRSDAAEDPAHEADQLERWLKIHMLTSDQALAEYLKQQGVET